MTWVSTTLSVLTAMSLVGAVFVTPLIRWVAKFRKENADQHREVSEALKALTTTVEKIGEHFHEKSNVSLEVGTLPSRVRGLEGRVERLEKNT